jgi:RNA polymerase sigma-70 factor, ECF subfamily
MIHEQSSLCVTADDRGDCQWDDAVLVDAARTQPEALGQLLMNYAPRLYGYVRARVDNDEDAADITQQVFAKAIAALPRYRRREMPFGAWLFRIAKNAITDRYRRRRPSVPLERVPPRALAERVETLEDQTIREEAQARVRALVGDLDDGEREIVLLRFVASLTLKEIGSVVGKSESSVHRVLKSALSTMKEQLHDER